MKKNKQVEEKILAKNEKNENEICPGTAAKKDTTGCNNCYTQREKFQNQTTENGEKRDNKKSAWEQDFQKQIKLKERERQCKHRKNIQKISLSKKDGKSLKNESTPGKRKSENEICTIVKKNKQVEEQILAKKKMKYVQVQQQRKILQDAIIVILRVKNPKTKLQKMAKKRQ